MGFISAVLIVLGVLALVGGVREIRTQRAMRRTGIHAIGIVLRHVIYDSRDLDSPGPTYAPVVRFQDEHGRFCEFESRVRTSRQRPAVGQNVAVVHPPGRPGSALLDTVGRKALDLFLAFGCGLVFLVAGVIIRS